MGEEPDQDPEVHTDQGQRGWLGGAGAELGPKLLVLKERVKCGTLKSWELLPSVNSLGSTSGSSHGDQNHQLASHSHQLMHTLERVFKLVPR